MSLAYGLDVTYRNVCNHVLLVITGMSSVSFSHSVAQRGVVYYQKEPCLAQMDRQILCNIFAEILILSPI